ncbi:hypothetical protein Mapa_015039 [Marchantia paleacea]|nr:hypothetical protein Mapa_015039 [Marchantia paleacea]
MECRETRALPEFAIDYGHEALSHNDDEREISLTFDGRGGTRWRTHVKFESGTFSAKILTPEGDTSGLNTSFYLSSQEGDNSQDEIDFDFLGKDKTSVHTNYYSKGNGNHEMICHLNFDTSKGFHEYTIRWLPSRIEWLVDGKTVRSEEKREADCFPQMPMYLYASLWNASDIDNGRWAGSYSASHAPYVCKYRDVRIPVHSHSKKASQ